MEILQDNIPAPAAPASLSEMEHLPKMMNQFYIPHCQSVRFMGAWTPLMAASGYRRFIINVVGASEAYGIHSVFTAFKSGSSSHSVLCLMCRLLNSPWFQV